LTIKYKGVYFKQMLKRLVSVIFIIAFAAAALAQPVLKVGAVSPSFALQNLQGKTINLTRYLGNQVIILGFFASWSKSCQQEIGFLQELAAKHKGESLKIIGISYDRKIAELKGFVVNNNLSIEILHDEKLKTLKDFRILILPTLFVIDQGGNINNIFVDFDDNVKEAVFAETDKLLKPAK
jgi:peroxiredoxin